MDEVIVNHFANHRQDILQRHRVLAAHLHGLGPQYEIDVAYTAALRRSFSLTLGFFELIAKENYICAAPLVRMQLDNVIRTIACAHVRDVEGFLQCVAKGKRIDQLRDRDGNRLTDKHIVDHLVSNEDVPWVRRVYGECSRYVHLSDAHFFQLSGGEGELYEREPGFGEMSFVLLVETFVMATELFYVFLRDWMNVKGEDSKVTAPDRDFGPLDVLENLLADAFWKRGLIACSYEQLVVVDGQMFPSVRARHFVTVHPTLTLVQLDIQVMLADQRVIDESFVGHGTDEAAALRDAVNNFALGDLPVMRVALWGRRPGHLARVEEWVFNSTAWRVTIGDDLVRAPEPYTFVPDGVNDLLKTHLSGMSLAADSHWVRILYARPPAGELTVEVLLDNEPLEDFRTSIANLPWGASKHYCSMRRFIMLEFVRTGQ